jgi:hypothetical protein
MGSPQPPVNNSAQGHNSPMNIGCNLFTIFPPLARGTGVTNRGPQVTNFHRRLSHPSASSRPKTNPQMTSANSHPIRTSLDLGPRALNIKLILKGILS